MTNIPHKLALGSAQWGLTYGVSNRSGQSSPAEVARILEYARISGINYIDTAYSYGQAESVLGKNDLSFFKITTKIPALNDCQDPLLSLEDWLQLSFSESLLSLNLDSVEGVLVHNCDDLFSCSGSLVIQFLQRLRSLGKCKKIGVSVYNTEEIEGVLSLFTPDIVQLPFSVFDQRVLGDGTLQRLKDLNVEVHARSVFLQGLLLMQTKDLPIYFKPWLSQLTAWHDYCSAVGVMPQHLAVDYVASCDYVDKVVIGVESLLQLDDLISFSANINDMSIFSKFGIVDPNILNPSLWCLTN